MRKLLIPFLVVLSFGMILRCKSIDIGATDPKGNDTTSYACTGKTQCSEMKSCNEANYYLKNCPNVAIDGDGDGIPCEDQLCGHE